MTSPSYKSLLPIVQGAFANTKGRYCRFPTEISGMFNDFHPEGYRIMGIVDSRGRECFHPDSIGTVGIFGSTVSYVVEICRHTDARHSGMYRDLINYRVNIFRIRNDGWKLEKRGNKLAFFFRDATFYKRFVRVTLLC